MHLWAHLQGGEAMGRCPFRATRPGGCRSGDHIHEAVTASPRTRPKRSPQGHGLLPNQQRTDALRPVSEPRSLRRLGSGRSRLQDDHRATTEAVGNALDSQPRQRNYCPSLFPAQWPLGRILGTTRRWLISARFFTYKFGAHPQRKLRADQLISLVLSSCFAIGRRLRKSPARARGKRGTLPRKQVILHSSLLTHDSRTQICTQRLIAPTYG